MTQIVGFAAFATRCSTWSILQDVFGTVQLMFAISRRAVAPVVRGGSQFFALARAGLADRSEGSG